MRRQIFVMLALLLALGAPPAQAQFALSPRGIFGMVTHPMHEMLWHLRGLRHHPHRAAGAPKPAERAQTKVGALATPPEATAQQDTSRLNAYANVLGFAFWPNDYADEFARYGYGDIAVAIAGPLPPPPATDGSARHAGTASTATAGRNPAPGGAGGNGALSVCQNADASTVDWLTGRIEHVLRPDAAQLASFDKLRGKVAAGAKTIKASCRVADSRSPTTRLAELTQQIWALHDAVVLARHSLEAFYDALSDEQRAKFASAAQAASGNAASAPDRRYRECAAQSAGASARLLDRIQQAVQPTRAQEASLDNLRQTSAQMEKLLLASCTQPVAKNPLARLDAADARLVAMNFSAASMQVALNDFYASLDPRQKAKFDSLGG